jgi:hypothetical protein
MSLPYIRIVRYVPPIWYCEVAQCGGAILKYQHHSPPTSLGKRCKINEINNFKKNAKNKNKYLTFHSLLSIATSKQINKTRE